MNMTNFLLCVGLIIIGMIGIGSISISRRLSSIHQTLEDIKSRLGSIHQTLVEAIRK